MSSLFDPRRGKTARHLALAAMIMRSRATQDQPIDTSSEEGDGRRAYWRQVESLDYRQSDRFRPNSALVWVQNDIKILTWSSC